MNHTRHRAKSRSARRMPLLLPHYCQHHIFTVTKVRHCDEFLTFTGFYASFLEMTPTPKQRSRQRFVIMGTLAAEPCSLMAAIKYRGAVAAGHPATAAAAESILREGGNAFDAVVGAFFAACVAEPVLASLGGGGFLLASQSHESPRIYDFFVQTPSRKRVTSELDFYPILADFGTTTQEFHIGMGSIAVPGCVRGMFAIHSDLGRMPLSEVAQPAIELARKGVHVNHLQSYIFDIVGSIYRAGADSFDAFRSPSDPKILIQEGELLRLPVFADFLEILSREDHRLFYEGEVAQRIVADCTLHGGQLTHDDLRHYEVLRRAPLRLTYRDTQVLTNPPPSCGGLLIAFALRLLEKADIAAQGFGTLHHLTTLAHTMEMTNKARIDAELHRRHHEPDIEHILTDPFVAAYRDEVLERATFTRGTTHISVMDGGGGVASMTVTNGEGCGYMIPGTGVMLNNMLGEEDLHPQGFHRWNCNQRITSMMSPTLLLDPNHGTIACGSGGSNRIRTAILQFLVNSIDFGMNLKDAVTAPRIHFENERLSIEPGFSDTVLGSLEAHYPQHQCWDRLNLFFGGVHAVAMSPEGESLNGVGDPRRGGTAKIVH